MFRSPQRIRFLIGDAIGHLWFDILRIRRQVVLDNLKIAFPEWTLQKRVKVGRTSVKNMGRSFVDFLMLPFLNKEWIEKNVEYHDLEQFHKAQSKNRGVLLLSLHLGSGDLACSVMSLTGLPIYVITKRMSVQFMDRFWFDIRTQHGTQFIEARDSAFDIMRALKQNAGVVYILDQYTGAPIGIKSLFFGKPTGTAYGLALFAKKNKTPVVPVYTYRSEDGRTHIVFLPEVPFEEKEDRDKTVAHMTQLYTNQLEKIISQHPEQWMWVHRRWKEYRSR